MSLATVYRHITDALWALGGIGAAAELGLDDFGPGALGLGWGEACSDPVSCETLPKEGEPCRSSCPTCSSQPLSR